MHNFIKELRTELDRNRDEKTIQSSQRFFKHEVKLRGVKISVISSISKVYYNKVQSLSKQEIFEICEILWQSGYMEEGFLACNWSYNLRKQYIPEDFAILERWVDNYISNWATCDTLGNHTIGSFIEMYPEFITELKRWAKHENRWMKRSSAVSLIVPARKGLFLDDIFEIADILLLDKDDMVQKGYGWMLKVASQKYQKEIFDYVISKKAIMPRTALRYAIEKMPKEMRTIAMQK